MSDLTAIMAGISALQTASEMAKSLLGLRDATMLQGKVIELQSVILAAQSSALTAQSAQSALLEEVRDLKESVARLEAWTAEKHRYQLVEVATGVFALELKPEESRGEPPHKICARCYEDGVKSILQHEMRLPSSSRVLICHCCGAEIYTDGFRNMAHDKPKGPRGPRR